MSDKLHNRGMELVLVSLRSSASFQIAYIASGLGNYESSFELACVFGIYSKICRELHGAINPLWYIYKRAVSEHRRIQCSIKVIIYRHYGA